MELQQIDVPTLKYDISANVSTLKNKVTSLGIGKDSYISGAYATYVGQEIGQFYGWVYKGIARTQEDLDNNAVHNCFPELANCFSS